MSYDIRLSVKVQGADNVYAVIARPEHDNPTYNLSDMFRKCMDWDYSQGDYNEQGEYKTCYYPCDKVIQYVEHGIKELRTKRKHYEQYNSPNGWGTIDSAITALESLRTCIYETTETIPIECIYMNW